MALRLFLDSLSPSPTLLLFVSKRKNSEDLSKIQNRPNSLNLGFMSVPPNAFCGCPAGSSGLESWTSSDDTIESFL